VLAGGVYSVGPDGGIAEVVPGRRGVGGLVPHRDGGVVVSGRAIVHARDGETREVLSLEGAAGFNDIHTGADGSVLAGALRFQPFKGEEPVPGEVWRISAPGEAEIVGEGVLWANGIGRSPDGARLYVSDYAARHVRVYEPPDVEGSVLATMPAGSPDGLAVDEEGGVWVALGDAGSVARFDAGGELDGVVDVPADFVSSISFGGADRRDVLITAIGGLFRARSEVPGVATAPASI
jgi:sugar lactone lactonase YvrE